MQYAIKQRLVSFGDDFDIRDKNGNKVYYVDGKAFTFGNDLLVKNTSRNTVARIKQRLMSFAPTYDIYRSGNKIATIRKHLFSFRTRFSINAVGIGALGVVGNLWRWDYHFSQGSRQVARVSKKIFAFSDSYGIDIEEGEDEMLYLCCAIVIDMILHKGK
jgi:uncharacterized protein YxjI